MTAELPATGEMPVPAANGGRKMLLDPGMDLTLRPMRYPLFYDRFRDADRKSVV